MSTGLSLSELREGYADGHLDPVAVTEAHLERIEREIALFERRDDAIQRAKAIAERYKAVA